MSTIVYKDNIDYVLKLRDIEESNPEKLFSALSFISSTYFAENTIRKYYCKIDQLKAQIAEVLCERKRFRRDLNPSLRIKEIYEVNAFRSIIEQGIVHNQDKLFRISPGEIIYALKEIVTELNKRHTFQLAITKEVLPFIFLLCPPSSVLLDVRTNYEYQQIQGVFIDDLSTYNAFKDEFDRIWRGKNTISDKQTIINLIENSIQDWERGRTVDLSLWPEMIETDR